MTWYNIGTVTATLNNNVVTGVGTAFLANISAGDGITIAGSTTIHEVTNVASDTQLSIFPVFPGTTGGGKSYSIVPVQGYVKDLADQAKQLILTFGTTGASASVQALVGITGTAETIPYFTSGSTMVAKPVSTDSVASTIAVRGPQGNLAASSLELGYNGTAFTPFIDFHSGATAVDYDTRIISDTPNGTIMGGRMVYYANGGHVMWGTGGLWENSSRVYARSTILGTVSQTSGVPTGAIIERGSNSNGEYTKFADGTLVCYYSVNSISIGLNSVYGPSVYTSYTWTYPAPFLAATVPYTAMVARCAGRITPCSLASQPAANTSVIFFVQDTQNATTYTSTFATSLLAIGRWF